jgi:tRNA-dihydrouridine synthase A
LMAQPDVVARGCEAMMKAVSIPVTVKHRIGIDDLDQYEHMANFVDVVSQVGVKRFTVHARKAWLQGLSPKENRTVPPLRYNEVYRLKEEFPHLDIEINGGIKTMNEVKEHLEKVDAVMIGRAAYDNPWQFVNADRMFFNDDHDLPTRQEVAEKMLIYIEEQMKKGVRMMSITRHILQLFSGQPGARHWRRSLGEASSNRNPDIARVRDLLLRPQLVR